MLVEYNAPVKSFISPAFLLIKSGKDPCGICQTVVGRKCFLLAVIVNTLQLGLGQVPQLHRNDVASQGNHG